MTPDTISGGGVEVASDSIKESGPASGAAFLFGFALDRWYDEERRL
jgi:hypothetical protein